MTFAKGFQISNFLVLLSGFVAILAGGGVSFPTAMIFALLLAICWFVPPFQMSRFRQFLIVAALFFLFVVEVFMTGAFGPATVRLMLGLALYKLFVRQQGADYLIVYLISFSLLLVASTYTLSIVFLVTLVAYIFFGVLTLVLFETRGAYEANQEAEFAPGPFLQVSASITLLTVLLAIPIFLAIPRGALGIFGSDSGSNVAGFSDSVSLGQAGVIRTNSEVIMRVSLDWPLERVPLDLKWKGVVLDNFDGRKWTSEKGLPQRVDSDSQGRFNVAGARRQEEDVLTQSFSVEPFSNVLFGAANAIQVAGFGQGVPWLLEDRSGGLFLPRRPREPFRYYVHSDIQSRGQLILSVVSGQLPEEVAATYLQLPELDPRIQQLAQSLTGRYESPVSKALQLELFLKERFEYTLQNPSGGQPDPLVDFLMRTRAGHCEYFAASHAVMLRALGIPSRVVNGFRRGEYNPWGDYYFVRQSDAHSWVEAFFPGIGWVEFDPTPPSGADQQWAISRALSRLFDSMDAMWGEVVTFDRIKQRSFFRSVWAKLEKQWQSASRGAESLARFKLPETETLRGWLKTRLHISIPILLAIPLCFLLFRYRRYFRIFFKRRLMRQSGGEIAQEYYLELVDLLRKKGIEKSPFETPLEFGRRAFALLQNERPVQIIEAYYRNRFGAYQIGERELALIYAALRELRRAEVPQEPT